MEVIDIFMEKSKNKFLNLITKLPKEFDWYLGIVIDLGIDDLITDEEITKKCEKIYVKSEKHIKLLKICLIDDYTLLLFGTDPIPYGSNIKGVVKSICKYLDCEVYDVTFIRCLMDMVFNAWEEQQYFILVNENKAYDLKMVREG